MGKKVAIIGGGPGGYVCGIRYAQLGCDVTIFEKDRIGGVCLNRGCIPTKALHKSAEVYHEIKHAAEFGFNVPEVAVDADKIFERKAKVVETLVSGTEQLVKGNGIHVIKTIAKLKPGKVVAWSDEAGEKEDHFDTIVIATGTVPQAPPIPGSDIEGLLTSDHLLAMREIPESMIVLGGGVVAMEFASIYAELGTKVNVIVRSAILRMVDQEVVKRATPVLKKQGIEINVKSQPKNIRKSENGYIVTYEKNGQEVEAEAKYVLLAMGRTPVTQNLGLEDLGIELNKGYIKVDHYWKTNVEGIYAIGDINGYALLAHAAEHQGIQVAEYDMLGIEPEHVEVPNCIFILPEIASIGDTEEILKDKGVPYKTSKFLFGANGKALALGETDGLVKVITDMNSKLLGVHIFGAHASDIIHEAILAMNNGMGVEDIRRTMHAHPTLPEAFYEAVAGIDGLAIHALGKKSK